MTTVIYRRQSLDKNADELGIERQLKECQRVAKKLGLKVDEVITDNSFSASKRGRPGYGRLVEMMQARQVDVVIILRIDRLLRLNDELEELIQTVERHPVRVITAEGEVDLSTPQGRLVARILVSVARSEMETKGARHKLANAQKAAAGKPHVARRPFGYEKDGITIKVDEAEVLRHWGKMILAGQGYKDCAYWANENGYTTSLGKQFYAITIRNMLRKPRYAGIRHYNGVDYPAVWEPVFDAETWEALQLTIRLKREARAGVPKGRKYLLTGLAVCAECGSYLNGSTKQDAPHRPKRSVYICRVQGDAERKAGCGGVTRNADALEEWIRQCILYRLDSPSLSRLLVEDGDSQRLTDVLAKREEVRVRKDAFTDDYADGTLDKAAYTRAVTRLETSLAKLDAEVESLSLGGLNVSLNAGESVSDGWATRGQDWRRALITMLIENIEVKAGITKPFFKMPDGSVARFDPSLVSITWRV